MKSVRIILVLCALLAGGCTTEHYVLSDVRHPEIAITDDGGVTYRGEFVDPEDLPDLLRKSGLRKNDTINIHCSEEMKDWRLQRKVMAILSRNGFTRPVLVSDRKAFSEAGRTAEERRRDRLKAVREKAEKTTQPSGPVPANGTRKPIKVRYKN